MKKEELIKFRDEIEKEWRIANKNLGNISKLHEEVQREVAVRRNTLDSLNALIEMKEDDE